MSSYSDFLSTSRGLEVMKMCLKKVVMKLSEVDLRTLQRDNDPKHTVVRTRRTMNETQIFLEV